MKPLNLITTAVAFTIAAATVGCGDEPPPPPPEKHSFTLEATVTDSQDNALPKVAVTVDGKVVGHTDVDGKFTATLSEFAGGELTLGVVAPDGYRIVSDDSVTEALRVTSVNGQKSGVPVFLAATAESLEKDYFFWVKTDCNAECDNWPVMLDGKKVAQTNALGYAHFSITDEPRSDVTLSIGTDGEFKPANPEYAVTLDADSTVYRIEQKFVDPTKKKRVVRRTSKKRKSSKKKAEKKTAPSADGFLPPKPAKKDDGVIDLFGE